MLREPPSITGGGSRKNLISLSTTSSGALPSFARLDVRQTGERIPYLAEASANLTPPPSTRVSTCVVNYSANIWGGSTTCGAALKVNLSIQLCHRNERTGARDGHVQCTSRQHARRRMAPSASLLYLARLDVRRLGRGSRGNKPLPRPRQHARTGALVCSRADIHLSFFLGNLIGTAPLLVLPALHGVRRAGEREQTPYLAAVNTRQHSVRV